MLHIHNGDCSADVLTRSGFPGEHLVWRESLITGPTPAGLTEPEWQAVRSQHLSEAHELNPEDCRRDLARQDEMLHRFSEHEEVILWFEHDLFCQTLLLYVLDWFSKCNLGKTQLSLICIGEYPGIPGFRGLGQLAPDQMASLFDKRQAVTASELSLAAKGWRAYCSPNPKAIEEFFTEDTRSLPFLKPALTAHLARFPSLRNGLGRVENKALDLISSGIEEFAALFDAFGDREPSYGFGDVQFWLDLKRLAKARQPLVCVEPADKIDAWFASDAKLQARFRLTETGKHILRGKTDFVELNGIDLWLGGVHLSAGKNLWRWDEENHFLT